MKLSRSLLLSSALFLAVLSACAQTVPVPAMAPPQAATAGDPLLHKSDFGVGLEGLADWSRALMFADVGKTSRGWGRVGKPWKNENTVKTDTNGWPTEDAGIVVIADTPNIGGTYVLSFEGRAEVRGHQSVQIEDLRTDVAAHRSSAQITVPDANQVLFLSIEEASTSVALNGGLNVIRVVGEQGRFNLRGLRVE